MNTLPQTGQAEFATIAKTRGAQSTVQATTPPKGGAIADRVEATMTYGRTGELPHEVNQDTGFPSPITNLRTGERCENPNALLATILADAINLRAVLVMWR
jgi:hypothetical protein